MSNNLGLIFTPYAWAKLKFLREQASTEVGGFGIAGGDSLLTITDIVLVKQTCSVASVKFDDESVADFFDDMVDHGLHPTQFGRIWIHTHPGASPSPSSTDETTFTDCFGKSDWAVMFIMADVQCYTRISIKQPFNLQTTLQHTIDYSLPFEASAHDEWLAELKTNVTERKFDFPKHGTWIKKGAVWTKAAEPAATQAPVDAFVSGDELSFYKQQIRDYLLADNDPDLELVIPPGSVSRGEYVPQRHDVVWHDELGEGIVDDVSADNSQVSLLVEDRLVRDVEVGKLIYMGAPTYAHS